MSGARPLQFWKFRRLRRDNMALRKLIGRLVSMLDRMDSEAPISVDAPGESEYRAVVAAARKVGA